MNIKTIEYQLPGDDTLHYDDVAISDGTIDLDEDYPFDSRIMFYFYDEAEFDRAQHEYDDNIGFTITKVIN
jgi:hypothetical protein